MKTLGYTPEEEDMSQVEEYEFYCGLIIKIGARYFSEIRKATLERTAHCFGKQ